MKVLLPLPVEVAGRLFRLALAMTALIAIAFPRSASAGPQHWGSGYPYLMAVETHGSRAALVAYEPPMRAKETTWISRWIGESGNLKGLVPGGLTAGDFWPGDFGTDYVVGVVRSGSGHLVKILKAPEVFSTKPWAVVSTGKLPVSDVVALSTGDLLGKKSDQLITASKTSRGLVLSVIAPPAAPSGDQWTVAKQVKLPKLRGSILGMACGDFWAEKKQSLAIATSEGGKTRLSFYAIESDSLILITTDAAKDLPRIAPNGLIAADYVKDGFDVLTFIPADPKARFQLRVAPLKSAKDKPSQGPLYIGRAMSRQWMPGTGLASSKIVMTGTFGDTVGKRSSFTAGRVFGYVNSSLSTAVRGSHAYDPKPDAEIAFTHRIPVLNITEGASNYGWPSKGETMGYEIAIKNNGQTTIPAGSASLRVWINTPYRNADTKAGTLAKPNFVFPIKEDLPAFDPMNPKYLKVKVTTKWPYDLIPCGPGATWKKVNLDQVGERWLVVDLDCKGDTNVRNNRYEAVFHSYTYHPIFGENANLANRIPTVEGDPCSLEYLARKQADAILCVWERSATTKNEDVLQRAYFDGYEIGFPDAQKTQEAITKAWKVVQDKYEGWRELDIWWGENQSWEKFDWSYSPELHESGHLFHPLGDLYGLYVFPVWTSAAKMADGTPVQIMTHAWGPDLFAEGYAVISTPGCEVMQSLVGSRGVGLERWWTVAPDRIKIRVLDRDGKPVPDAEVTAWRYFDNKASGSGTTGPDGCWDISYLLGKPTVDNLGRKHYYHDPENGLTDAISQVFTVKIGKYQDCAVWGSEDTSANGRHTVLYHSYIDEKGWTWDFKTNYKPGAPEPSFTADAAIEGSKVEIGITGNPDTQYRLYRRWEPSYIRNLIGEYRSTGEALEISQDLAEPDSRMGGRFRAIYEVTEVNGDKESLPRVLTVTGLTKALGVTSQADGKLLVTTNSGRANPCCVLTDGKTYQEYFYHYRFGHTANKAVQSKTEPGKYFMTVATSDLGAGFEDHRFDVVDPLSESRTGYDIRNNIGNFHATAASDSAPFTITMRSAEEASRFSPGDGINAAHDVIVTKVVGDTLYTDKAAFAAGQSDLNIDAVRLAGRPGDNAEMRELKNARGLDTVVVDGKEYIVIADTGNGRIAVWNSETRYVKHWQKEGSRPAAIAVHPTDRSKFFAIDRNADRKSMLYLFSFDGKTLTVEPGYPVAVDTGDASDTTEIGLAAAANRGGDVIIAITDAEKARVIEVSNTSKGWEPTATYTTATGTYAGNAALTRPTDVAYTSTKNGLELYAIDGNNRLVRLR